MPVRYLLDEHVDPLYKTQILRQQPDLTVWLVGDPDAPPRGTLDPDILRWRQDTGFILVTNNRASMPGHLIDHVHSQGMIFLSHMTETPELFDLYDPTGRPLGRTKPRDMVHRDGDWHRSAHVWIFTSDRRLLFQRRAADKDTWPGRLDAAVGGHYHAGESAEEGMLREAREELGLTLTPDELIPLGVRRVESREPGIDDRELQDIYLLRRDLPLMAYQPDPVEIDALVLLDAADAAWLHAEEGEPESELDDIPPAEAASWAVGPGATVRPIIVTPRDLIPGRGAYITAIARAVSDALAGRPPRRLSD